MSYIGTYEDTVYRNPADGYCVIRICSSDGKIPEIYRDTHNYPDGKIRFVAKGYDLPLTDCVELILDGSWEPTAKYGYQYRIDHWEEVLPHTLEGIKEYLLSGIIKGIDRKAADAILQQFGTETLNIMKECPERLLAISCLPNAQTQLIMDSCRERWAFKEFVKFLEPYKFNPKDTYRIFKTLGADSLDKLQKEPYLLGTVPGFSFARIERFARKINYSPHDKNRIKNAVIQIMKDSQTNEGHLFLKTDDLFERALKLLNLKISSESQLKKREVFDVVYDMVLSGALVSGDGMLYLAENFLLEDTTACDIARLLTKNNMGINIMPALNHVIEDAGITLSQKQKDAVEIAFATNVSIVTGSPGTGKTTVLYVILEIHRMIKPEGKIIFAAPTGRASRRMAEATGFAEAKTLHMALGLVPDAEESKHANRDKIEADLIIIDETSMVDMKLAAELFSRIREGTRVLLVGDADQLPSVGAGNVFHDLITCNIIPVTKLDKIFRQSQDSLICKNTKKIKANSSALSFGPDFILKECRTQQEAASIIQAIYKEYIKKTGIENVQILTPFREKGQASMQQLNQSIQDIVNPPSAEKSELAVGQRTFRLGDRVMQTVNNYAMTWELEDGTSCNGVFNGDNGIIKSIDMTSSTMLVNMDGRLVTYDLSSAKQLDLSFAITIHKAMGSEYDTVIIPLLFSHQRMLYRNLIYTAISRSKQRVILVGQKEAISMAIHSIYDRNSELSNRIQFYFDLFTQDRKEIPPLKKTG